MHISRFNSIPRFALPYTAADFAAGLRAVFDGGPPPEALPLFGDRPKFWTRSGRQALRLLLGALNLKPGSGVALPLFTDPSLFKAIVAAGHRPVFIDVDPCFLTIDPQSLECARGKFSAVVAVHLFGQLAEMPAVMAAARGVPVIEDQPMHRSVIGTRAWPAVLASPPFTVLPQPSTGRQAAADSPL